MMDIFTFTTDKLSSRLNTAYGKGKFHAIALSREILKNGNLAWYHSEVFRRSQTLTRKLRRDLTISLPEITKTMNEDGTLKFLCRYEDGLFSESVVIPMKNHNTLCVSSQIGCRMGCRFCETGSMGFKRNLSASEIVSQVFLARFMLKKDIKNIVFMGMGEPFDNFEEVSRAVEVLSDQQGFDIAHRHITLSTAGLVDGIEKLKTRNWPGINLALSLNATNDTLRSHLMPVNRRFDMKRLKQALMGYPLRRRGLFLIEYVLIKGVNDSRDHARELTDYLTPLPVRINLIPLNKTNGFTHGPTPDADVHRFARYLEDRGFHVVKRWSKGDRLAAGCGQLGAGLN